MKYISVDYRIRFAYEATGVLTRFTDCGLFETGINKEETLQNLQRSCIINNVLYDLDMWVSKGETYDDELLDSLNAEIIKTVTENSK